MISSIIILCLLLPVIMNTIHEFGSEEQKDYWLPQLARGEKMWITNGTLADIAVVWTKNEDGEVEGFLVEKGTPGFSAHDVQSLIIGEHITGIGVFR